MIVNSPSLPDNVPIHNIHITEKEMGPALDAFELPDGDVRSHFSDNEDDVDDDIKVSREEIVRRARQDDTVKNARLAITIKYRQSQRPEDIAEESDESSLEDDKSTEYRSEETNPSLGNDSSLARRPLESVCDNLTQDHPLKRTKRPIFVPVKNTGEFDYVSDALPSKKGPIKKKGKGLLHLWKNRFLVLEDRKLFYYKGEETNKMRGCIDFKFVAADIEICEKSRRVFNIKPKESHKVFSFKAADEREAQEWVDMINKHKNASDELQCPSSKVCSVKSFWKHERISEDKFLEEAQTGDLLLFRTNHIYAKLQRSFTRGEYDHVALLIKFSGELLLFECTGTNGVTLCSWEDFKQTNWQEFYGRLVYRKLHIDRTDRFIEDIEKFAFNVIGNKYGLSAKKLLQKKSVSIGLESQNNRTFFCSELIAACYKKAGILPVEISSSQYLPSTFSSSRKINLLNGVKLGNDQLITFD